MLPLRPDRYGVHILLRMIHLLKPINARLGFTGPPARDHAQWRSTHRRSKGCNAITVSERHKRLLVLERTASCGEPILLLCSNVCGSFCRHDYLLIIRCASKYCIHPSSGRWRLRWPSNVSRYPWSWQYCGHPSLMHISELHDRHYRYILRDSILPPRRNPSQLQSSQRCHKLQAQVPYQSLCLTLVSTKQMPPRKVRPQAIRRRLVVLFPNVPRPSLDLIRAPWADKRLSFR